ncbi:hypothetical protein PSELUDRAFT_2737 [Vogesella sp. LIG4]|nr:hypothetical protein PSELUDRAFT_2737 [Vogesella sp. LIG4]
MKLLAWGLLTAIAALGFWAYLQPLFVVKLGNMLSACF